ncbi:MAG: TonB-dependent receptor plug domain-containing protein [Salinivirgaceae bacterium]|nr:TonB-dependent receptor plug domain-containing protein [Salinivirgaceae bacterium]
MNLLRKISIAVCITLAASSVFAQKGVKGVVRNQDGEPIIGANVFVKGTTVSTISGLNGEFLIPADSSAVLLITFNGFQNLEVPVRDLATADLKLKPAIVEDEGFYGNDNFYNLTTSNTLVTTADAATGLETDVYQFLLGRVPGLEIVSDGGNPWGKAGYRLRGGYSPTGDNGSPLFVVDGAYFKGSEAISALNPADIVSIRVLKDAAARAQYGDLGDNGVIVISTRQKVKKALTVSYDGNASYNTCDETDGYKNSVSTKHNARVEGVAGPLPYRATIGYNMINGVMENTGSNRLSTSVWVGPSLLDNHLKIDFNGYFRKCDNEDIFSDLYSLTENENSGNPNSNNFMGTLKTDYSLHFFEDLHVNILASYANTNTKTSSTIYYDEIGDWELIAKSKHNRFMFDGNIDYNHEFDKEHYIELKAGATFSHSYFNNEINGNTHKDEESTLKSFYGQFNVQLNRFLLNLNSRFNDNSEYDKLSAALSLGVKAGSAVVIRTGFGLLGLSVGDKPEWASNFNTLSYNFGIDIGKPQKRFYSSLDFYVHTHPSKYWSNGSNNNYDYNDNDYYYYDYNDYNYIESGYKWISLFNIGGELSLGVKLIDSPNVKWRIGGNASCNASFTTKEDDLNFEYYDGTEWGTNLIGERPLAYTVYESAYNGENPIEGVFVDKNNDGKIDNEDLTSTDLSPIPAAIASLNTYFEAMNVYLQVDSHASLGRYNIVKQQEHTTYIGTGDIHNSSFLRIDDIVLGYRFKKLGPLSGRAYAAVQNPVVITKYEGDEPEIFYGHDYKPNNYQRPIIFSMGVKLNINIKD